MNPVQDGHVDIDYHIVAYPAFPQSGGVSCVCYQRGVKMLPQLLIFPVGIQGSTNLIWVDSSRRAEAPFFFLFPDLSTALVEGPSRNCKKGVDAGFKMLVVEACLERPHLDPGYRVAA